MRSAAYFAFLRHVAERIDADPHYSREAAIRMACVLAGVPPQWHDSIIRHVAPVIALPHNDGDTAARYIDFFCGAMAA